MTPPRPLYLAGTGMITAIGDATDTVCAAVKAGVSRFGTTSYFTKERHQIVQALVPDEALPPLGDSLAKTLDWPLRCKRMLRMSAVAASEAMQACDADAPVPVILAGPEVYPGLDTGLPRHFLTHLVAQSGLPLDVAASRVINMGRAGVIEAVKLARHYLHDMDQDFVLVGGCDSYQHTELLQALDREDRVAAQHLVPTAGRDDFIPGEGACFLLFTRLGEMAMQANGRPVCVGEPGFGHEPGHWFSDEPYRGEGLFQAVAAALHASNGSVNSIYASLNGESYWGKELGVAVTRCRDQLGNASVHHPAEYFGDTGAAAGALQIALAAQLGLNAGDKASLVYCSSDQGYRAAVSLTTEGYAA